MKPTKFIWEAKDTFDTIHKKLLKIKGTDVVNALDEKLSWKIFDVGEIIEYEIECIGKGFFKFLAGDFAYQDGNGGYNFKDNGLFPVWAIEVTYGTEDTEGNTMSRIYRLFIPRILNNYEMDLKENSITVDENHPFIFYEFQKTTI